MTTRVRRSVPRVPSVSPLRILPKNQERRSSNLHLDLISRKQQATTLPFLSLMIYRPSVVPKRLRVYLERKVATMISQISTLATTTKTVQRRIKSNLPPRRRQRDKSNRTILRKKKPRATTCVLKVLASSLRATTKCTRRMWIKTILKRTYRVKIGTTRTTRLGSTARVAEASE